MRKLCSKHLIRIDSRLHLSWLSCRAASLCLYVALLLTLLGGCAGLETIPEATTGVSETLSPDVGSEKQGNEVETGDAERAIKGIDEPEDSESSDEEGTESAGEMKEAVKEGNRELEKESVKEGGKEEGSGRKDEGDESDGSSESQETAPHIVAPDIPSDEFPVTDGSTATLPLGWMLYRLCTGESQDDAEKAMKFTKTNNAYLRLMEGEADLVIAYEPGPNAKADVRYKDIEMKPIGLDALIFICNAGNPVESLTTEQIQEIYAGSVRNWNELGGEDADIIAFQREQNSGSQTLMEKLMMQGIEMTAAPAEFRPSEMGELIDGVAGYANTKNALGYSVYYYAKNMYKRPNLRFMAVDGILPSNESIRDGSYGYVNPFYAAIRKDEDPESAAHRLFDWLTTEDGQSLVEEMGYVSIEKGTRTLPRELEKEMELSSGRIKGNEHRLVVNAELFDGNTGVVILGRDFQVESVITDIRLRGGHSFERIRGSVFPAARPIYAGQPKTDDDKDNEHGDGGDSDSDEYADGDADDDDNYPEFMPLGLYDADKQDWAVEPDYDFCYTESTDGVHAIYYMMKWSDEKNEDGEYTDPFVDVYSQDGVYLRTILYDEKDGFNRILARTSWSTSIDSEYDEDTSTSIFYLGNGLDLIMKYGDDGEEDESYLEKDGKRFPGATDVMLYPYMSDGAGEDDVPWNWQILNFYNYYSEPEDGIYFKNMNQYVVDRDGNIVFTCGPSDYRIRFVDENFLVAMNYDTGKYVIYDYEGNEVFSWLGPDDEGEYWDSESYWQMESEGASEEGDSTDSE